MKDNKKNKEEKVDLKLNAEYRPARFEDVVGQDKVKKTLIGSIATKRVQNAYLLEGESGSGKTTLARIFANSLICENRKEDCEPCGECDVCKSFASNPGLVDVIEIDAGENRGIDKVRELKEVLKYMPKVAYRVVIIDEAHMLTREGATALLKPIEEPPERTVFMIATTEPDKIMDTIRNRCMKLKFNKIPAQLIEQRLRKITVNHNIEIEDEALMSIAISSKGVMREAISILEQVSIEVNNRKIVKEDLKGIINKEEEYVERILSLIFNRNIVGIMDAIDEESESISEDDFDYIISRLRRYLMTSEVTSKRAKVISLMINVFIEYKNKVMYNIASKTLFELSAIDCINIAEENTEVVEWLLNRFDIQDVSRDVKSIEGTIDDNMSNCDLVDREDAKVLGIVKEKSELFMDLMSIMYEDFEYRMDDCSMEINDDNVLCFTVSSVDSKKDITAFLKKEYAQKLKPICEIEGFIVRVR